MISINQTLFIQHFFMRKKQPKALYTIRTTNKWYPPIPRRFTDVHMLHGLMCTRWTRTQWQLHRNKSTEESYTLGIWDKNIAIWINITNMSTRKIHTSVFNWFEPGVAVKKVGVEAINDVHAHWPLIGRLRGDAGSSSLHMQSAALCPAAIKADSGAWGAG